MPFVSLAFDLSVSPNFGFVVDSKPFVFVAVGSVVRLDVLAASDDPIKLPVEFVLKSVAALFGLLCVFDIVDDDADGAVDVSSDEDMIDSFFSSLIYVFFFYCCFLILFLVGHKLDSNVSHVNFFLFIPKMI